MPGHEYFTRGELAAREIMRPINRAKNVAFAFVLAAWIPAGLRMYEAWKEKQLVPTPIADFFFPRTAEAELKKFEEGVSNRRKLLDSPYSDIRFVGREVEDIYLRRWELSNNLYSEIRGHSIAEAAAEAGILMGLGGLLYQGLKRRAERK